MGAAQWRQRARSSSQLSSGMLSRGAIGEAQAGQADPGRTSDSPRGTRWMTTLANDPKTRPKAAATMAASWALSCVLAVYSLVGQA